MTTLFKDVTENNTVSSTPFKILAASAFISLLALSGCSQEERENAKETANETFGLDEEDVFSLKAGSCFDDPRESSIEQTSGEYDTISSIPIKECNEPHDNEAYYNWDITDATSYVELESDERAQEIVEECSTQFEAYTGTSLDTSNYDFSVFSPSMESWADGDREILCYIFDPSGSKIEKSLKAN